MFTTGHATLFSLLIAIFRATFAAPTLLKNSTLLSRDSHHLDRRQCIWNTEKAEWDCDFKLPTLDEMRRRMQDQNDKGRAIPTNTLWFYTGWGDYDEKNYREIFGECYAWMSRACLTHYAVGNALNLNWLNAQNQWNEDNLQKMNDPEPQPEMNICYYQSLSVSVLSPDVYLFIPPGMMTGAWDQESDWEQIEFWPLTWNPYVKNIWRADPKAAPGQGEKLIWTADAVLAATKSIATGRRKVKTFCKSWPASGMSGGFPVSWPKEWGGGSAVKAMEDDLEK